MATKSTDTATREVRATAKYVRVSPSKARLVVDLIRNKTVAQAFDILHFCTRSVAVDVEKVLRSAVANAEHANIVIGKAGRKRKMNVRPTVRGTVMNPVDHPHGGGEGKNHTSGRPSVTPWGKPTKGYRTRNKKKTSNALIIRRRKK